jgi:hypothetical protein
LTLSTISLKEIRSDAEADGHFRRSALLLLFFMDYWWNRSRVTTAMGCFEGQHALHCSLGKYTNKGAVADPHAVFPWHKPEGLIAAP